MQTSFGDLAVVDAHAHFFSHRFFATLAASLPEPSSPTSEDALLDALGARLAFELPPKDPEGLAKRWVQELDRQYVSRA